jgi:hypothetical protein
MFRYYGELLQCTSDLGDYLYITEPPPKQANPNTNLLLQQLATCGSISDFVVEISVLPPYHHVMQSYSACLSDVLSLSASATFTPACLSGLAPRIDRNWSACEPEEGS